MLNKGSNEQNSNENSNQLELGFSGGPAGEARCTKPAMRRRHSQASVWFRRMRQIVESARDWQPAPPAVDSQPSTLNRSQNGPALSHERQLTE